MNEHERHMMDEIFEEVEKECHVDDVGLWEPIRLVKNEFGEREELMELTLSIVSRLLDGPIVAMTYERADRKYHVWQMPKKDVLARIRKEWLELGREPNIGEVVYFTAVERLSLKGDRSG